MRECADYSLAEFRRAHGGYPPVREGAWVRWLQKAHPPQYLSLNETYRIAMTIFRASSHVLEIEWGSYTITKTAIGNSLCHTCKVVEDELHFLLKCRLYDNYRLTLFPKIIEILPTFPSLADPHKYVFLLSNKDSRLLSYVGKFLFDSFNKRNEFHSKVWFIAFSLLITFL